MNRNSCSNSKHLKSQSSRKTLQQIAEHFSKKKRKNVNETTAVQPASRNLQEINANSTTQKN